MGVSTVNRDDDRPSKWARLISVIVAAWAVIVGGTTLLGWAAEIRRLTEWANDGISMFPNTAVCALGSGLALLTNHATNRKRIALMQSLGMVVALVGALTLLEHLGGRDLGIDRLLFDRRWGLRAASAPLRMGPPASLSFLMAGAALVLMTFAGRARTIAAGLGIAVAALATLSLTGFLYGAQQMYTLPRLTGVAMQTALATLAIGIGIVTGIPEREPMRAILERGAAGTLARRSLPFILIFSLALGWLRVTLQGHGWSDAAFAAALRSLVEIALLTTLLAWAVSMVRDHEQALLKSKQELADAARRKDEFLATLAHELRNPLAPLSTMLQIMDRAEGDPVLVQQARETMQRQLRQLVRLVDDLLDISRVTRDKLELRRQQVQLCSIIQQSLETCRPMIDRANHRMIVQLPSEAIYLEADPVRLSQVFSNLLNNACKYTDPGGTIVIAAEREGSDAIVRVRDNGIGIPPEMLPRVFEMFAQFHRSLDRAQGGLGLGLALVKRLVQMHDGSVQVQSDRAGRGAEFIIRLPILLKPLIEPAALKPAAVSGTHRRVLVVDDNTDAARSLALLLKLSGHETKVAHDGLEAFDAAQQFQPEVVLLDIGLPKMNGHDVCRRIRSQAWGKRMCLIALTGWGQEQDRDRSREAGFDAHLVKPIDFGALTQTISALPCAAHS